MVHYVIAGGGLAGLYMAYRLAKRYQNAKLDIYEAKDRLGGRIFTKVLSSTSSIELGAGRFNKNHKRVWKMLKELSLEHLAVPVPRTKTQYVKDGIPMRIDTNALLYNAFSKLKQVARTKLKTMTLRTALRDVYEDSVVEDIIFSVGYDDIFDKNNAYNGMMSLERDLLDDNTYYVLQGGLNQIIDRLAHLLAETGRVNIHLNHSIDRPPSQGTNSVFIDATNMKLSTSPVSGSLMRIYVKWPTSWFKTIPRTTTNNPIRQFIPVDPKHGIAMAVYCTDKWASYWNLVAHNPISLENTILRFLREMFPRYAHKITRPTWVRPAYWPAGAHYWPSTSNPKYTTPSNTLGEAWSPNYHGWMEGALETVDQLMQKQ